MLENEGGDIDPKNSITIKVAKNRHGATCKIEVNHCKHLCKFWERTQATGDDRE